MKLAQLADKNFKFPTKVRSDDPAQQRSNAFVEATFQFSQAAITIKDFREKFDNLIQKVASCDDSQAILDLLEKLDLQKIKTTITKRYFSTVIKYIEVLSAQFLESRDRILEISSLLGEGSR